MMGSLPMSHPLSSRLPSAYSRYRSGKRFRRTKYSRDAILETVKELNNVESEWAWREFENSDGLKVEILTDPQEGDGTG
jgi:hypothetical protein